jgi:hypothetical protein
MVGFDVSVNVLLSVVEILERIFTQVTKLSKEICTVPEHVVSSEFVVIEDLSIAILKVTTTGVFDVTPVAESAGEVDVTDGRMELVLEVERPFIIAAIIPKRPGLGLLTSKGERFAFKQLEEAKHNMRTTKLNFFIFEILFHGEMTPKYFSFTKSFLKSKNDSHFHNSRYLLFVNNFYLRFQTSIRCVETILSILFFNNSIIKKTMYYSACKNPIFIFLFTA